MGNAYNWSSCKSTNCATTDFANLSKSISRPLLKGLFAVSAIHPQKLNPRAKLCFSLYKMTSDDRLPPLHGMFSATVRFLVAKPFAQQYNNCSIGETVTCLCMIQVWPLTVFDRLVNITTDLQINRYALMQRWVANVARRSQLTEDSRNLYNAAKIQLNKTLKVSKQQCSRNPGSY